jgi:DNA (cytosine-5)-methyltransferase 1
MKTMHLFAGIGGGLLSDLINGHEPIIAVEWDKCACAVLRDRVADGWFPDMQVYEGDVRMFNPSEYAGRVDCIHAGFPCQDISNAGKQAGVGEETRSGLYREVLRIADVVRPQFIFMENVSAILSNGLGTVLGDLAARGYDARWICVRASDVGANHQRDRWWLLATMGNPEHSGFDASKVARSITQGGHSKSEGESSTGEFTGPSKQHDELADSTSTGFSQRGQPRRKEIAAEIGAGMEPESKRCGKDVADTTSQRQQGQREYVGQINTTKDSDREADRTIDCGENRKGWWELEPELGRLADGVSDRVGQLKGYGNAQVPLQAAVAFKILEAML